MILLVTAAFAFGQTAAHVIAGESRSVPWDSGEVATIASIRTAPPLAYPPLVDLVVESGTRRLRIVTPPATPAGEYTLNVTGRDPGGRLHSATIHLTVDAGTVPASATGRPPVILLNGFQVICTDNGSAVSDSTGTFGQLASLLQSDGASVLFFNNCAYGDISIEQLASQLNTYIANLRNTDGTAVAQVDLVAHSMGGLIVRAYLAGKGTASGSFAPPANPKVRKFVAAATPHFGSFQAANVGVQESEMAPGSQVLWDLATWNQGQDDLRGVDALAVIGNAGTDGSLNNAADGVVSLTSASLDFTATDQRTRIVPYCHITPSFLTEIAMSCSGSQGIVDINDASHLTAQIVRSFLADTTAWQSIGGTPSQDPFLKTEGGTYVALKGTTDVYFKDLTSVQVDNATKLTAGPSSAVASIFYTEFATAESHSFSLNHSSNQTTPETGTIASGGSRALLFKQGPVISGVQSTPAAGLPGLTVASGSNVAITGAGFGTTAATQLSAGGTPLSILQISDQQITAYLPASYTGLVQLSVTNANGQASANVMTTPVTGALPAVNTNGIVNNASYALGTNPLAPGMIAALFGTNLTDGTSCLPPACNQTFGSNGRLNTTMTGAQVTVNGVAVPIFYSLPSQLGIQIPSELTSGSATVQVAVSGKAGPPQKITIAPAALGIFTVSADGKGAGAITHADGSIVSTQNPGHLGETVVLYATGLGSVTPAVPTGALPGSTSTAASTMVTIGGIAVSPSFAGLSGCCVGLNQVNFQIPTSVATGSAVSVSLGIGVAVSNTVTVAIQ